MDDGRRAHLNLVESSRRLFALDPGAEVEATDGWMLGAGTSSHPLTANAAFRIDDGLDPGELLERGRAFFGARGRGFAYMTRAGAAEDEDMIATAGSAGLRAAYSMPEMTLDRPAEERPLPDGATMHRVESAEDAAAYWRVAAESYTSIGFPPDVFGHYSDHAGMNGADIAAFLVELDGEPVSIAMTIVAHGVAGIYWVGSRQPARGRGLGWATTAAAVSAGFDMGADMASLQASPMGKPLYERMGFETIFEYRLFLVPAPSDG